MSGTDPFIEVDALAQDTELLRSSHILPVYRGDGQSLVLREDAADIELIRVGTAALSDSPGRLFPLAAKSSLTLAGGTSLEFLDELPHPGLGPALRSLARTPPGSSTEETVLPWLHGTTITAGDAAVLERASTQASRVEGIERLRAPDLAGATSYMGSKRELAPFLVEAVFAETEGIGDVSVLDLMCGSGAAAGAFANHWQTFASDAQRFSTILACSQGGGMTALEAREATERTLKWAAQEVETVMHWLEPFVNQEDELLHAADHDEAVRGLRDFMAAFPRIGMKGGDGWAPTELVERAREDPSTTPHVLFTAYFANVFFGVRQCVEIDSLRAAIDRLDEPVRSWALAALIASVASVATTYGGHFAQPRIATADQITEKNVGRLVEQRSMSVVHEFAARFLNLAAESERTPFPVVGLEGPWEQALTKCSKLVDPQTAVVYLDPPYRREEYSRYYHVLETLVRYDYPGVQDTGLVPPKGPQRFASEFFTRSMARREQILAEIVCSVLEMGATCAWSYADSADGSIANIVRGVVARTGAKSRSYSTTHRHRAHGGRRDKQVVEYLIWFHPAR
jgi:hypothetical protein